MRWEYETTHLLHFLMFLQFMFESNVDILVAHLFSFLGFLLLFCFGFCCCCCFVSCVPSVPSVFVLYLVCPVFPVSSSCILCAQCSQCLRPVSCLPNFASVSRLCILDCTFGFLWRFSKPKLHSRVPFGFFYIILHCHYLLG
jgi:hypothetical protein